MSATPAFLFDGGHHFVTLQVFADGLIECRGLVDLAGFRARIASGQVRARVPDGERLWVFGLATWQIDAGSWELDGDSLYARVAALVTDDGHGGVVRARTRGERLSCLARRDGRWYLADLRAFADGAIELGGLPGSSPPTDLAGVRAAVAAGELASSLALGTRVSIHGVGSFAIAAAQHVTAIDDVVRDIPDLVDRANGRPDSVARCRAAFRRYDTEPSNRAHLAALRVAYDAVPTHKRKFCGGNLDLEDWPIRRALRGAYADDE